MKFLYWMRGPLREEAPGDPAGGGAPAFDPVKFKAEFMADVKKLIDARNKPADPPKPQDPPEPEPGGDKKDPAVKALEKQLQKLQGDLDTERKARGAADEAAKKEKRNTTLTTELGKLGIQPDRMKSALRAVDPDVKWDESGALVGDDDSPLSEYLTNWIKGNEHFLPPKPVGGSGASGGSGRRSEPPVDLDDIKPGMSADQLARVRAAILAAAPGSLRN